MTDSKITEADEKRPYPLIGYAIIEDLCEDWSHWDGAITGPGNPRGANLSWIDPIPFIEKSAYDQLKSECEGLKVEVERLKEINAAANTGVFQEDIKEAWKIAQDWQSQFDELFKINGKQATTINNLKDELSSYSKVVIGLREQIVSLRNIAESYSVILLNLVRAWKVHQQTKFKQDGEHFRADIAINNLIEEAREALEKK